MPEDNLTRFRKERERMNQLILKAGTLQTKRFFAMDTKVFESGALPAVTKEIVGLVASLVLRCDDCILYHLIRCKEQGVTSDQLAEALDIGLVIGGSITIPHIRRARDVWVELEKSGPDSTSAQ